MSRRLVRIEHPILYIPSIHEGSVYPKDSSDVKSERQYDPIFESRAMEERSSRRFMKVISAILLGSNQRLERQVKGNWVAARQLTCSFDVTGCTK